MSSVYGNRVRVTVFGQSHSEAVGVVVDGLPAGFAPDLDALHAFMARRAPGQDDISSARSEPDEFELLSGIANGRLCGAPFAALIRNRDRRPGDYAPFYDLPRPGHADYTARIKYHGFEDASGGGHFSGRLTAPICLAGGLMLQMLAERGVRVGAHLERAGGVADRRFNPLAPELEQLSGERPRVLDKDAGRRMREAIRAAGAAGDSVGGVVELAAVGLPAGLGDPIFDGLENRLARAIFAIPAVKGLEFGDGFGAAELRGSENNDAFVRSEGRVTTATNRAGGVLGGISVGTPVILRAAFKPTPSIGLAQRTLNARTGKEDTLTIGGRHDPCVALRAVPCVEAAAAIALFDALLEA